MPSAFMIAISTKTIPTKKSVFLILNRSHTMQMYLNCVLVFCCSFFACDYVITEQREKISLANLIYFDLELERELKKKSVCICKYKRKYYWTWKYLTYFERETQPKSNQQKKLERSFGLWCWRVSEGFGGEHVYKPSEDFIIRYDY